MTRKVLTAVAVTAVAIALARRLIFHGTTTEEILLGTVIVVILIGYAVYELFENRIKSSVFYRSREASIDRKSRLVDLLFLFVGSIGLGIGFLLYEPTTLWLQVGRIFILTVSVVGTAAMSWRIYLYWRGRDMPDGPTRHG